MIMYNDNDAMFEVDDFDADIKRRQELIEEAKKLDVSLDGNAQMREISNLKRAWKKIHYWESEYEDKLAEEFDSIIDVFYAKRREGYKAIEAAKEELIKEAEELSVSKEWNKASEAMNALMAKWKAAGSAGKEVDDALWERFNAARQNFFDAKHAYWQELQSKFANAREVKEGLIASAKELADSKEWQKTNEAFKKLMSEWKSVGSAGREFEDQLWNEFNGYRQQFYQARNEYYEALHEAQAKVYAAKKELVETAREILDSGMFTKENTQKMKALGVDWKNAGSCGREKEDTIWKEFRTVMDEYFDGLKQWNQQRHEQWRQRMIEAKSRKMETIANQKRQIQRMQNDIVGLLGERAIAEMQESIEDKKEYIKRLEEELADIEKSLEE